MTYEDYEIYSVSEYAEIKKVSTETIRRWIKQSLVKSYRVGKGKKRAHFYVRVPR